MAHLTSIDPWIALGVVAAMALTDAVCVMFMSSVIHRRGIAAANWGALSYLLSAFAVISFTSNWIYVVFAALGSWIGAYIKMKYLHRPLGRLAPHDAAAAANIGDGAGTASGLGAATGRAPVPAPASTPPERIAA